MWSLTRATRGVRRPAEVRLAELAHPGVVVVELAAGVPELERRVAVAAVLPVDQAQPVPLLDVVVGQEIVVARHARERDGPPARRRSPG